MDREIKQRKPCTIRKDSPRYTNQDRTNDALKLSDSDVRKIKMLRKNKIALLVSFLVAFIISTILSFFSMRTEMLLSCNIIFIVNIIAFIMDNRYLNSAAIASFSIAFSVVVYDSSIQIYILIHFLNLILSLVVLAMKWKNSSPVAQMIFFGFFLCIAISQFIAGYKNGDTYVVDMGYSPVIIFSISINVVIALLIRHRIKSWV